MLFPDQFPTQLCGWTFIYEVFDIRVHTYLCTYVKAHISNCVSNNIDIYTQNSHTYMYDWVLPIHRKIYCPIIENRPFTFVADIDGWRNTPLYLISLWQAAFVVDSAGAGLTYCHGYWGCFSEWSLCDMLVVLAQRAAAVAMVMETVGYSWVCGGRWLQSVWMLLVLGWTTTMMGIEAVLLNKQAMPWLWYGGCGGFGSSCNNDYGGCVWSLLRFFSIARK